MDREMLAGDKQFNEKEEKLQRRSSTKQSMREDIVSDLPEELRNHIISFLPLKDAVATTVLSKRWRYIWSSSRNLDFDYSLFPTMLQKHEVFVDFIDRTLGLRVRNGPSLQKLRVSLGTEIFENVNRVDQWIVNALRCKVQELDLDISSKVDKLPSSLFENESLTMLKLKSNYYVPRFPSTMIFSRLKTLDLVMVGFLNSENLTPEVICSCPKLEDLNLERCYFYGFEELNFTSQTLKGLIINNCDGFQRCKIKISTPSLLRLKYFDPLVKDYSLENLSSLVEVCIHIEKPSHKYISIGGADANGFDQDGPDHAGFDSDGSDSDNSELSMMEEESECCVGKILRGVSRAEVMEFSFLGIEFLSLEEDLTCLPTFFDLRHLNLTMGSNKDHLKLISCFLEKSPNLETLKFNTVEFHWMDDGDFKSLPKFFNLKYLKINIRLFDDHIDFLTCLLEKSPNLETLVIDIVEPINIVEIVMGKVFKSEKLLLVFPIDHVKTVEILHLGVTPKNIEVRHRASIF